MIRMRPGVPWNVKGIEAEAREAAQLAARRAGVSLGEYLTQLIMTEGRPGAGSAGYTQAYNQGYQPGDGTYGPQPMPQYQPPVPSLRYPHAVPQAQPQSYSQAFQQHIAQAAPQPRYEQQPRYDQAPRYEQQPRHDQQARYEQQPRYDQPQQGYPQQGGPQARDPLTGAAQTLDNQLRGSEFAVVAHGLRDLADRLDNSERRAQAAIATVNQSVAAMQDRIDAAERVKQLADVAFTSAADALAQSARDQVSAFESLESTVRSVQKRMNDIEAGNVEWPSRDAIGKLETALGQLQKRLGEVELAKPEPAYKDALGRLEVTLGQLQKRLGEMEQAKSEFPNKDALTRLETWINDVRHDVADSEKRSREDISQLAKFMRELGTRVDTTERSVAQVNGSSKAVTEGVAARLDALEARSASMFDEMRGQLGSIDGRLAQTSAAKGAVQPEAFNSLKRSVETLSERVEQNSKGNVSPDAFAALKRSVDTLSSTFDGLTERLDLVSDPQNGPLAGSLSAIGSTLEALTTKIEDGERRSAESVSTVSGALKTISTRLDETDKKQTQALQAINRRFDDADRHASESSRVVEDSLKALNQRLEASDKKHKEAIGGLRLTVDGLVAKAAAEAVPLASFSGRQSSPLPPASPAQQFAPSPPPPMSPPPAALDEPPEFPPFSTTTAKALSGMTPPPPTFLDELPPKTDGGYSLDALQTIMAGTLSAPPPSSDPPNIEPDAFDPGPYEPERVEPQLDDVDFQPKKEDFLTQARRAAKAAAEAEAERAQHKRPKFPFKEDGQERKVGRLVIIGVAGLAVVAGIIALLFTIPSGGDEINRPDPGSSIGEILNGPAQPATPGAVSPAEFAPPSAPDAAASGAESVTVEPNGLGVPTSEPAPAAFTAGTSALPGGAAPANDEIATLEAASARGDASAQFLLALRYAEGRGVDKDDAKAASLATKAAQQGLVVAEYRLGAIYERGLGVPKDLGQAKIWYERAAKGGNRKAMHNLAVLFADGTGVGQNFAEASRWFRQGAEYGLADSQYNLGILLERGMGVEKNPGEAAKWYAIAAAQGDSGAAERLEQLKRTMSAADVAMSLEAARKFQPKPLKPSANEAPAFTG